MLQADVVISATGCPHVVLTREEAERIAVERNRVALVILDIAMPRDVDPEVRRVDGILLYDLEGLERTMRNIAVIDVAAAEKAEKMVEAEAHAFRTKLQAQGAVPTIVALRQQPGRVMPARTGFLYRGARAVYPGAGSVATRNHSTSHTEDCQLPRPRTQGTSREGGAGANDRGGHTLVPPGVAERGACRHHIGEKETGPRRQQAIAVLQSIESSTHRGDRGHFSIGPCWDLRNP